MNFEAALALAAQEAGAGQHAQPAPGPFNPSFVVLLGAIFLLFYFMIIRPQRREQKRQEEVRNAIKKGDKVVTIGGIHGTVAAVDTTNNIISVQVDKNVKIDFSKAAISTVISREDARESDDSRKSEK